MSKCIRCGKEINWDDGTLVRGSLGGLMDFHLMYESCPEHAPKNEFELMSLKSLNDPANKRPENLEEARALIANKHIPVGAILDPQINGDVQVSVEFDGVRTIIGGIKGMADLAGMKEQMHFEITEFLKK